MKLHTIKILLSQGTFTSSLAMHSQNITVAMLRENFKSESLSKTSP